MKQCSFARPFRRRHGRRGRAHVRWRAVRHRRADEGDRHRSQRPAVRPVLRPGQDQFKAYHLAIDEINAKGGIMGMKVRATEGDDQTKADVARDNAQRMIERDGAVMITGGSSTGTALAVSALCQSKKTHLHGHAHARRRDDEPELPQGHVPPLQRRLHERAVDGEDAASRSTAPASGSTSPPTTRGAIRTTTTSPRSSSPRAARRSRTCCSSSGTTDFSLGARRGAGGEARRAVHHRVRQGHDQLREPVGAVRAHQVDQDPRAARRRVHGQGRRRQLRQRRLDRAVLLEVPRREVPRREAVRRRVHKPSTASPPSNGAEMRLRRHPDLQEGRRSSRLDRRGEGHRQAREHASSSSPRKRSGTARRTTRA